MLSKPKTILFGVLVVTVVAGAVAAWRAYRFINAEPQELAAEKLLIPPLPLTFQPTFRGCMPGWIQGYKSSDGYELVESSDPYESPGDARREMLEMLKGAEAVIERTVKPGGKGPVFERVVVAFPAGERGKNRVEVIWVEDAYLRRISAPTARHALALENTENR
jgi:hypothetical protein